MKRLYFAMYTLLFFLCLSSSARAATEAPTVVLMSIDGFRWDYINKYNAPNLRQIVKNGVRAEQMRPIYPTKTFPNHLSIITGLYAVHHGIVDNNFCDKVRQECYRMGMGKNDATWLSGIPLWNLAEINGVKAATYFWPESEARINGMTPSYYYPYSDHADDAGRVDQILDWLALPPAARPHFVTGYFSLVDTIGHQYGPDSSEVADAVQKIDAQIGRLRNGLQQLGYPVNLIVVSDHGMATIDHNQAIDYRDFAIDDSKFRVVNSTTRLMIYAGAKTSSEESAALKDKLAQAASGRYRVMTEQDLAERHFTDSPRIADIILETTAPRYFTNKPLAERRGGGTHGYTYTKDMGALFVAEGPAFKQGVTLPPFDNINIYPLVSHILNLPITHPVDGTLAPLQAALKE
ncbi:alkaline phosphatase family protein [Affinibrenneria salicis]|uniref:Alkaline phosphatase family protein n=1 Tax=Affinibrenneria salicis TaxID=2590031 RepID=A0A5J5G022_9GAMM|nr:ectonucleotide pyrophosphatase/phosphodiesterase [Affinibrenneria salicis]KAA8999901.1 alkaline phosphatase family protein [Affinibrenneria salicis]